MFNVGDEVRLARGWTRMVVIGFRKSGEVIAKYDTDDYHTDNRVTDWNFKNPFESYNTQTRPPSGFVYWDGAPATKVYYTMANNYYVLNCGTYAPGTVGTFLCKTGSGDIALQMADKEVCIFSPEELSKTPPKRQPPNTFSVRAPGKTYRADYLVPSDAKTQLRVGTILISNTGNLYMVTALDTKAVINKGEFKGQRLVTAVL